MTAFTDLLEGSFSTMNRHLKAPAFTWKGKDIACVPDNSMTGMEFQVGGSIYTIKQVLRARLASWATADSTLVTVDSDLFTVDGDRPIPVSGKILSFRGKTYRVLRAGVDPSDTFVTLTLCDPNSGR